MRSYDVAKDLTTAKHHDLLDVSPPDLNGRGLHASREENTIVSRRENGAPLGALILYTFTLMFVLRRPVENKLWNEFGVA